MKFKLISLFLFLLLIFSLSGCIPFNSSISTTGKSITMNKDGKSIIVMSTKKETNNSLSLSYKQLDGTDYQEFYLKTDNDREVNLNIDFTTISGKVDIYIYKNSDENNDVYNSLDVQTSNFNVKLPSSGGYTIKIKGLEHNGGYKLTW